MADTSLIPGSKKSETVLVTTISNQHLCTQTTTLGPTLTLQFGTDKLDQGKYADLLYAVSFLVFFQVSVILK